MRNYNKVFETRHGRFICSRLDHYIGGSLDLLGESCELELQEMLPYIGPNSIVLDAGACIGTFAVPIARRAASVLAIEPERSNYLALCGNVAINSLPNVLPIQAALSDREGDARVPAYDPRRQRNIGGMHLAQAEDAEKYFVPMLTVDALNQPFSFIKIDVENMEAKVIAGASKTIEANKPVIYCEMLFVDTCREVLRLLTEAGYDGWLSETPIYNPNNFNGCEHNPFADTVNVNAIWIHRDSVGLPRPDWDKITKGDFEQ